jgi:hypothetical protein
MKRIKFILFVLYLPVCALAQHPDKHSASLKIVNNVEPQPLLSQASRLIDALSFLGSSLSADDINQLKSLQGKPLTPETSKRIQEILDPYCLAMVNINPESRVKVERGPVNAKLIQGGWKSFLIKVNNEAGITPQLKVHSPNAYPLLHVSSNSARTSQDKLISRGQVDNRFLEVVMYNNRPLQPNLSGLKLEYAVLQVYCKDAGQREVEIGFNVGQGSQDIGFRNFIHILFTIQRSVKVKFRVKDEDGSPAMASFLITDGIERMPADSTINTSSDGYRLTYAQFNYWFRDKQLAGIYPLPSRRVAVYDEYPDFFFQPQVYRYDGEYVKLPPGKYKIEFTRGPEYVTQVQTLVVPSGVDSLELSFKLKRWLNMSAFGWYSADHHVHAAGCSHYESPEEGVPPDNMWRQIVGEDLNMAALLTWGPSWYHQKGFFTGNDDKLSNKKHIMHYDVEVSGFPSSHAGHVVLLQLKEDDYPGTTTLEEWPSWTLPVLQWAKSQGAVVGYAHSGLGLEPLEPTKDLPNYVLPKMDGIGANEYVVTVTQNVVDIYSAGNTPALWELNMWYHTLNCGFRTRLSGETDFPCMFDERVGLVRSYFKTDNKLSYDGYMKAIKDGASYVSDGSSHIINFTVNGLEAGVKNSELSLTGPQTLKILAKVIANLPAKQTEEGAAIVKRLVYEQPYWSLERARIGTTQKVGVELLVNGQPVDTIEITADGKWKDMQFNYALQHSAWIAMRIYPSVHTNPVFVIVDQKPIRSRKSAEWCRQAVDQCWKMKQENIRSGERAAAEAAYNKAREIYDKIVLESSDK